jgi:hypothetical protein
MTLFQSSARYLTVLGFAAATASFAQISSINSATYHPREFNDVTNSLLTVVSNYPTLIAFNDQNVSAPSGFANRHVWRFSSDGGATAHRFTNDEFFTVSMTVTLTATPESPRKEAGFLLDTIGGQGQFIVNSDAHEVVAFGGPLPFYAFPATYHSGDTITLAMTYFRNTNGNRAIIYYANGVASPIKEFTNLEQGIIDNSTLGGYLQIVNAPNIPTNSAMATFANIHITTPDMDLDTIPDTEDLCPNTPFGDIVNATGCSVEQLVPCAGPRAGGTWRNHGQYVSSIARTSGQFVRQGLMTEEEQEDLVSAAAQSNCGQKTKPPRRK